MTEDQKQEYLASGGVKCPYCGHAEFYLLEEHLSCYGGLRDKLQCVKCEKVWYDLYTLTNVSESMYD